MATIGDLLRSETRWDAAAATKSPKRLAREFAGLIGVLGYDRKEYDRLARQVSLRLAKSDVELSEDFEDILDVRLDAKDWPRVDWLGMGG